MNTCRYLKRTATGAAAAAVLVGLAPGAATAKPEGCTDLALQIQDAYEMAWDLEDQGNRLEAKRQYRLVGQLQARYDKSC